MFEVTGNDVEKLTDPQLRELVKRLCLAEIESNGFPSSSLIAGGHQDARDGGIDVRVDCSVAMPSADFIPRKKVGFQAKASKMPRQEIRKEMRPKGKLRTAINDLMADSGAYVIVSSKDSLTDEVLRDRIQGMRDAIGNSRGGSSGLVDFYDRDRLAIWINKYPGVVSWVREAVGRKMEGWSFVPASTHKFVCDGKLTVHSPSCREKLSITQTVVRLRSELLKPKVCIRLVGVSGTGKTRILQAMFETEVEGVPLNVGLSMYTDFESGPLPSAVEVARWLVANGKRAILIVDNCNPSTHKSLVEICSREASKVSLLTVEYDVQDGEAENTDVYRVNAVSTDIMSAWIAANFPKLSESDCRRVSEFSGGNFRLSRMLATSVRKGETLAKLSDIDLFRRIFVQRKADGDAMLRVAEAVSLLYSIEVSSLEPEGELSRVGNLIGMTASSVYQHLVKLKGRDVLQARGDFRAILPEAIALYLASEMLTSMHPQDLDAFVKSLTPRMTLSMSRRLSCLHHCETAVEVAAAWLSVDGPLGDLLDCEKIGLQVVVNLAPIHPGLVLRRLESRFGKRESKKISPERLNQILRLLVSIAFDANYFNRAALLYAQLLSYHTSERHDSNLLDSFARLFHLKLSGTWAAPSVRRELVESLIRSKDQALQAYGFRALRALLNTGNFVIFDGERFGARSRDYGWSPGSQADVSEWYGAAVELAVRVAPVRSRKLISCEFSGLWRHARCHDALMKAAREFSKVSPWIEGWMESVNLYCDWHEEMNESDKDRLRQFAEATRPSERIDYARAVVLDEVGERIAWRLEAPHDVLPCMKVGAMAIPSAFELGNLMAQEDMGHVRRKFFEELVLVNGGMRSVQYGKGLGIAAFDLRSIWRELISSCKEADVHVLNVQLLNGFVEAVRERDTELKERVMDDVASVKKLVPILVRLQSIMGFNDRGIERIKKIGASQGASAMDFRNIHVPGLLATPVDLLNSLITTVSRMKHGDRAALELLYYCFHDKKGKLASDPLLIDLGRTLLSRVNYSKLDDMAEYYAGEVMYVCLSGAGASRSAKVICSRIRKYLNEYRTSPASLGHTFKALSYAQPSILLDVFLLRNSRNSRRVVFSDIPVGSLVEWADVNPAVRYPMLGPSVELFTSNGTAPEVLSDQFVQLASRAPDLGLFMDGAADRFMPSGWAGLIGPILERRQRLLCEFFNSLGLDAHSTVAETLGRLDAEIQRMREWDRSREASFE